MYRIRSLTGGIVMTEKSVGRRERLIITKIQIEDFEGSARFEASFDSELVFLSPENAAVIKKALGIALKSRFLVGDEIRAGEGATVRVRLDISGKRYAVTAVRSKDGKGFGHTVKTEDGKDCEGFYDLIYRCAEVERLSCFSVHRENRFSDIFRSYRYVEEYYSEKEFSALTDGIGNTEFFRRQLNEHIKECNKKDPNAAGVGQICINEKGEACLGSFAARRRRETLNEADAALLEFLCWLSVNRFWQKIEEVRDFNRIRWPLFVFGLRGEADGLKAPTDYADKAAELKSQIFICRSLPKTESEKPLFSAAEDAERSET